MAYDRLAAGRDKPSARYPLGHPLRSVTQAFCSLMPSLRLRELGTTHRRTHARARDLMQGLGSSCLAGPHARTPGTTPWCACFALYPDPLKPFTFDDLSSKKKTRSFAKVTPLTEYLCAKRSNHTMDQPPGLGNTEELGNTRRVLLGLNLAFGHRGHAEQAVI